MNDINNTEKTPIYMDHASTTYPYDECIDIIKKDLEHSLFNWGNPSNTYALSESPKAIIKEAKTKIAKVINCDPSEIYFTSGASEGNAFVCSQARASCKGHAYCSPFEHHNYTERLKREHRAPSEDVNTIIVEDSYFPNMVKRISDYTGTSPLDAFKHPFHRLKEFFNYTKFLSEKNSFRYSIYSHMLVDNITGSIFNVKPLFAACHELGMLTACDCTQALGNLKIDVKDLGCDIAVFSGHKVHAPKGIGFMYISNRITYRIKPLIYGTQQKEFRGGTENVPYIDALGYAVEKAEDARIYKLRNGLMLKDQIIEYLEDFKYKYGVEYTVNEIPCNRCQASIASTISFSLPNIESEVIQSILSDNGIYIGTGSGCSDGSFDTDYIISKLAPKEFQRGTFRLSFDLHTTFEEVEEVMNGIFKNYIEITGINGGKYNGLEYDITE